VFEAVTVHIDTVDSLPPGGVPLAHNDMGLQAAEIKFKNGGSFWGVQYHPEYSLAEAAAMVRRYAEVLIRDGLARDQADLDALAVDFTALDANPADTRLAWRLGVGEAITNIDMKLAELRNWLVEKVLK
jgi:GMP synthase (glutamine-hydrolysing)